VNPNNPDLLNSIARQQECCYLIAEFIQTVNINDWQ
jgi:hypothetical protein